ncbi:MAG: glycoside hydrolase family 3 C-terminal domain-containing protein [Oscillospiraceae bacterium]|nr:glycoside hydrolase family 3 C-terminal domain-containing protein [Oscillospiraceae bacterium]
MKKCIVIVCLLCIALSLLLPAAPAYATDADARVLGDVNGSGEVDIGDARLVLQYLVGKIALTDEQLILAKVSDGEDAVSVTDARLILQFLVDKIAAFPGKLPELPEQPPDFPYPEPEFPYQDIRLTCAERAADLVSRMTLSEKQAQLGMRPPAIVRLEVPAYDYWNEALHGITEKGPSTSFPVPFSMASSWNAALMKEVAGAISDEARGYAAKMAGTGRVTLSYWSPTVNLARDPRWGRNEESYGEDPYLTAVMAGQFVDGMQGSGDGVRNPYTKEPYLKTISTLKHYAANNSEFNRRDGDSVMDDMTLRNYYTRAFMDITLRSPAASVMTAFNRVNGTPATANTYLLDTLLRKTWGFGGHVVSDCGAVQDLTDRHRWIPAGWSRPVNRREAAAFALKAGTDMDCGYLYTGGEILNAYNNSLITGDDIDLALLRIFTNRMKTGEFDPPEIVRYREITAAALEAPRHRELALQMARESLVLLKNQPAQGKTGGILPLDIHEINSIAVCGPLAKVCDLGAHNYIGEPTEKVSFRQGLDAYLAENGYKGTVSYYDGVGTATAPAYVCNITTAKFNDQVYRAVEADGKSDNMRLEPTGPGPYVNIGNIFPGSWLMFRDVDVTDLRQVTLSTAAPNDLINGRIEVRLDARDGYLAAEVEVSPTGGWQVYKDYTTDNIYAHKVFTGLHDVYLNFYHVDRALLNQNDIDRAAQADIAIVYTGTAGSSSPPGFMVSLEDQDRASLKLPSAQDTLIAEVAKKNANTIAVIQSAGIHDLSKFRDSVKAILYSSYNGQYQGTALAETLFGANNPSGRLPVTWYRDEADIPGIADYTVKAQNGLKGRTYMYFTGLVEYPFGYGLSYTDFSYSDLALSKNSLDGGGTFNVTLKVTNTGGRAGADVVQVYIGAPDHGGTGGNPDVPQKELKGFARVNLAAGETKIVTIPMKISDFSRVHENNGLRTVTPGVYKIMVGRSSADIQAAPEITVTSAGKPALQTVTLRGEKVAAKAGAVFGSELTLAMSDESFLDAAGAAVVYTSSNAEVAEVDEYGSVTAISAGAATITAAVTVDGVTKTGGFPVAVN